MRLKIDIENIRFMVAKAQSQAGSRCAAAEGGSGDGCVVVVREPAPKGPASSCWSSTRTNSPTFTFGSKSVVTDKISPNVFGPLNGAKPAEPGNAA